MGRRFSFDMVAKYFCSYQDIGKSPFVMERTKTKKKKKRRNEKSIRNQAMYNSWSTSTPTKTSYKTDIKKTYTINFKSKQLQRWDVSFSSSAQIFLLFSSQHQIQQKKEEEKITPQMLFSLYFSLFAPYVLKSNKTFCTLHRIFKMLFDWVMWEFVFECKKMNILCVPRHCVYLYSFYFSFLFFWNPPPLNKCIFISKCAV